MRRTRHRFNLLAGMLVISGSIVAAAEVPRVPNLAGQFIDPFERASAAKAVVLLFVSTECPYSNRSAPEIRRIKNLFEPKGVRFWLVYPNPAETTAMIRAHLQAFGYPDIALRDTAHALVKYAGPTVTPEAAVFTGEGRLVYRGRIDDRFVALGRERPSPTRHDLEDALTATLAGKPVVPATTQAFGCFLADLR
jgi:hypothetical protein